MHYAFDKWIEKRFPNKPFCRYPDDGLVHCNYIAEAEMIRSAPADRWQECDLEIHPDKTTIERENTLSLVLTSWVIRFAQDGRKISGVSSSLISARP